MRSQRQAEVVEFHRYQAASAFVSAFLVGATALAAWRASLISFPLLSSAPRLLSAERRAKAAVCLGCLLSAGRNQHWSSTACLFRIGNRCATPSYANASHPVVRHSRYERRTSPRQAKRWNHVKCLFAILLNLTHRRPSIYRVPAL